METCVLYMRMSTDKQDNSIPAQRNVLINFADRNNYKIVTEYKDEGVSGRRANKRPAFLQMIEDSGLGAFAYVLIYDSSRFARNLEESLVYKSALKKNGVTVVSATEPTADDDSALITDAMFGAINEMYSRKLSKSVKRGMVFKAQQGHFQTPPPFGYVKSGGVVRIVEDEARTVRMIYQMFIDCPSWHSVAVKLNNRGVRKRNAHGWYSRDIKRMLMNPAYIGCVMYDGQVHKGRHEAIIDNETWQKTEHILSQKPVGRSRPPSTYKHWLSGLLNCAHCGGRMNHVTDSRGNTSYRCSKHANGCCKYSNFMSVRKLELLTKSALENMLTDDNMTAYEYFVPKIRKVNGVGELKALLKKVHAKLERHKNAYANGIDTMLEYKENKARCQNEESEIRKQIAMLSSDIVSDEKIKNLRRDVAQLINLLFSDQHTVEEKSRAIKTVVDKIRFNKFTGQFTVFYYL